MEGCLAGPALLVAPDNVWYGGVTEADVPELVERHLIGGEPVELLWIGPEGFARGMNRPWEGTVSPKTSRFQGGEVT